MRKRSPRESRALPNGGHPVHRYKGVPMSERYTKRDAVEAFKRLAEATGATIADPSWGIHDPRREGAWTLDHNGVYGGYVVEAYTKDSPPREGDDRPQAYTAVTMPLGYERRSAREFCEHVNSALRAMDYAARRA